MISWDRVSDVLKKVLYSNVTVLDIIIAFGIILLVVIIAKIVTLSIRRSLREKVKKGNLDLVVKLVYATIIIIGLLTILPIVGIQPSGLQVAGGIVGIVIGFASQSIVSNLISGIFLIIERPIAIGDEVEIGGKGGFVEDVRIFSTIIRGYDGIHIRIPNDKVFTGDIMNLVMNTARRFSYIIGISYKADLEKAMRIIEETIDKHPYALKNPHPDIYVKNLGDSSVDIKVRIWVPSTLWLREERMMFGTLTKAIRDGGIEIPFPQRVLWFGDKLAKENEDIVELKKMT